ncbi:putative 25 kDa protein [Bienertia sinuspersici]
MPKKTPSALEKVSNFVKTPISLAKMRKYITLSLISSKRKSGRFNLYRQYNYGFIQEYQFSPLNTPLMFTRKKQYLSYRKKTRNILFMCMCLGNSDVQEKEEIYSSQSSMELMPPIRKGIISGDEEEQEMLEIAKDEYGLLSVDERAERFIEKFYAQMRMQCQNSSNEFSMLLGE